MADRKQSSGWEGLFESLTDLTQLAARLNDLMEEADEITGERTFGDADGKITGRMGWSVRTLDSHTRPRSIPPRTPAHRPPPAYRVRRSQPNPPPAPQPALDIFDEGESVLVILDAPVENAAALTVTLSTPTLMRLQADTRQTEVTLPRPLTRVESVTITNGILTVELR